MAFLYSKDIQGEKEIREMIPFTIVTNYIKYLAVTLTKQVKVLYNKNFKSLKKETEDIMSMGMINSKNGRLTKSYLQIQCNSHQNSNTILYRP